MEEYVIHAGLDFLSESPLWKQLHGKEEIVTKVPSINDEGSLPRKKKQTLFVIFVGPKQPAEPGPRYIANDGSTTTLRSKAARFWTYWDAKAFAELNHIALNVLTYIGREYITDFEVQRLAASLRAL